MKRRWNLISALMVVFAFVFICKANVAAYGGDLTVTERTKTSIGFAWTIDEDLSRYDVTKVRVYLRGYDDSDFTLVKSMDVNNQLSGSYTLTGLKAGERYYIKVTYDSISKSSGTVFEDYTLEYLYDCTLPGKVTGFGQDRWYYFIEQVNVKWNRQTGCTGYEYYFYNNKNKVVKHEKTTGTYFSCPISNSVVYHGKVRAYTTIDGKTYYGAWSDTKYFFTQPQVKKAKISKNKLTVSWKKVSGATSYTIFISNKANGKGFKKIATVSSKKTSYTSKKFAGKKYSSKKKYYVYIRTNKKVKDKTSTSGKLYYWDTKNTMYYF